MTASTDRLIVGNWKMNGDEGLIERLASALAGCGETGRIVVCPPATLLREAWRQLSPLGVEIGCQDCHVAEADAYTGDLSAALLARTGARHVILGHSERRAGHGETDRIIREKAVTAVKAGLQPIICVGDSAEARATGRAEEVVVGQVRAILDERLRAQPWAIAYEPIWAIGSGVTATRDDIAAMHAAILQTLDVAGWARRPVLYGGSVSVANAEAILNCADVGGLLIGGASLDAKAFATIAEMAGSTRLSRARRTV